MKRLLITLLVSVFVLTACAPAAVPTPTATVTVLPTATLTLQPTVTVTPVPTATHTPIPTSTFTVEPTADFSDLNECRTWFDATQKCPATLADLNSGRLVNFAKSVMKPFPPDALKAYPEKATGYTITYYEPYRVYDVIPLIFNLSTEGLNVKTEKWMYQGSTQFKPTVFASPISPMGDKLFFFVKSENISESPFDLLVLVVKLKTKSGKVGYYVLVCPPVFDDPNKVDKQKTFNKYYEWIDKMTYQPPYYNPKEIKSQQWSELTEKRSTLIKSIIEDITGDRKKLMDEWVNTGDIPEGLEKLPLYPYINGDEGWGFSKR
jgi:hypothetical protein